ncbi:MAG: hypothetical protein KQ78_01925 [Candidatus Izimaplasma bacterium HR2]|nr:MAG: hypothetical protein KQ78_01925 [Candidatus Izimaplasma bacterium HR2]
MAMKENTKRILSFLQENASEDMTHNEVAEALELGPRQVIGSFNSFVKKGWGYRVEATVKIDGADKTIKFLKLNDEGLAVDVAALE